jgi:hypothetical protein
VRYDPENPENARIHTFLQTWGSVVISGIVGAVFVVFGCWCLGPFQFRLIEVTNLANGSDYEFPTETGAFHRLPHLL